MSFDSVFHGTPDSLNFLSSGQASLGIDVSSGILYFRTPANGGWQTIAGANSPILNSEGFVSFAQGGTANAFPFQGMVSLPNLEPVSAGTINPAYGAVTTLYGPIPLGKRAIFALTVSNPTFTSATLSQGVNISSSFYVTSGGQTIAPGNIVTPSNYVAEAGESFAVEVTKTSANALTLTQVIPNTNQSLSVSSVATSVGGVTAVYTGTGFGSTNAQIGMVFVITGFVGINNNGTFICTASTSTTLTLSNGGATIESAVATATSSTANAGFLGTITNGGGNAFAGHSSTTSGFTNAGNNTTLTLLSTSTTSVGGAVSAPITETHPGALADNTLFVITPLIVLFDNTSPLKSVKLTSLSFGNNTLYTVPTGLKAYNANGLPGAAASTMFLLTYTNNSGLSNYISANLVRNGGSVSLNNQMGEGLIANSGNITVFNDSVMSAGDFINLTTNTNSVGQFIYTTVWEGVP